MRLKFWWGSKLFWQLSDYSRFPAYIIYSTFLLLVRPRVEGGTLYELSIAYYDFSFAPPTFKFPL